MYAFQYIKRMYEIIMNSYLMTRKNIANLS